MFGFAAVGARLRWQHWARPMSLIIVQRALLRRIGSKRRLCHVPLLATFGRDAYFARQWSHRTDAERADAAYGNLLDAFHTAGPVQAN